MEIFIRTVLGAVAVIFSQCVTNSNDNLLQVLKFGKCGRRRAWEQRSTHRDLVLYVRLNDTDLGMWVFSCIVVYFYLCLGM